jgi:DNA-binding NarL/FixJ family response regulator
MINVQIADDHAIVVQSLSKMINESDFARVTNVYYTLTSCIEGLTKQLPDVLLLDIGMPDGDGVEFCAAVTKMYPSLKIIMLTGYRGFNIAKHSLNSGARGYILKNADPEEMFAGIKAVNSGKQFLCEEMDALLKDKKETDAIWLTDIEKSILRLCADGYTRRQIAEIVHRDAETVKSHLKNIRVKLFAKNTTQAVQTGHLMKLI